MTQRPQLISQKCFVQTSGIVMMGLRLFLLFVFFVKAALGGHVITNLAGFPGELPFYLESGYVGVDEGVQLFYLFAESQNSVSEDPLILWLLGGPGCSSLPSFFFENGPLTFNYDSYKWDGSLPELFLNNYTWTKNMSIIYLDAPAGTGYSYSTTQEGWLSGDDKFPPQLIQFLRKWLLEHPTFISNNLYLGGDGYAGIQIPIAIQQILDDNRKKIYPSINIKGYVLGNPGADHDLDFNARYTFSNRLALVSDELYELADSLCSGNFTNPPNEACEEAVAAMDDLISNINSIMVIEPACKYIPNNISLRSIDEHSARRILQAYSSQSSNPPKHWCRKLVHTLCYLWASNTTVQRDLFLPEGMTFTWQSCNDSIIVGPAYDPKIDSVVDYHKNLTKTNLRGLIYSGDHDMETAYISTQKWIKLLDLPLVTNWSAWSVNDETAGYMRKYTNGHFNLTFTTVKGGGHFAAEYRVEECFDMVKRWMVNDTVMASA